jgi:AcrR family transcriptional regulator
MTPPTAQPVPKLHPPARPDVLQAEELPPAPCQERSRRKRDALLDAALQLFAEHGYEGTSVEEIAHRAGVAVGGFYQHFRSKRQVLLVLMDALLGEIARMDFHLRRHDDPRLALEDGIRRFLHLDWAHVGAYRAWSEAIIDDPELAALNEAIERWTLGLILAVVRDAAAMPGARPDLDSETAGWILNLLFWKIAQRPSTDLESVVRGLTHLLYHALFRDA